MVWLPTRWTSQLFAALQEDRHAADELKRALVDHGETIVVVGSRNDSETFPYGFFQMWKLNSNTARLERFARR
jgi:hypothetical protein